MDEPTNHLDMRSKKVLQDALKEFEGTFVIVSHDRAFLDPLVNKVAEFSHGGVRTYSGNVSDYLYKKRAEAESTRAASGHSRAGTRNNGARLSAETDSAAQSRNTDLSTKERRRTEAEKREELSRRVRPLKNELKRVEDDIARMEKRRKEIEGRMADPDFYRNAVEAKETSIEYKDLEKELEKRYSRWSDLMQEIEKASKG
ncbi:MAG TPA: ABC transporter ATP-binding protein, partial [Candidatus Kryptobacter bacterium]|nr:ABC transporter ATP-binding protein [Candidatus Kryptobacter bacterium]